MRAIYVIFSLFLMASCSSPRVVDSRGGKVSAAAERVPDNQVPEISVLLRAPAIDPPQRELASPNLCHSGRRQSPIDLRWNSPLGESPLSFDYSSPLVASIKDTGHGLRLMMDDNQKVAANLRAHGESYTLRYIDFKTSSEHSLSGKHFPIEAQLYHQNSKGEWAAVAIFFEASRVSQAGLNKLWLDLGPEKAQTYRLTQPFWPASLLPSSQSHYSYVGSLTHPPCTEGVTWHVLNTPLQARIEEIAELRRLYPNGNRRAQQSMGEREPANFR